MDKLLLCLKIQRILERNGIWKGSLDRIGKEKQPRLTGARDPHVDVTNDCSLPR